MTVNYRATLLNSPIRRITLYRPTLNEWIGTRSMHLLVVNHAIGE